MFKLAATGTALNYFRVFPVNEQCIFNKQSQLASSYFLNKHALSVRRNYLLHMLKPARFTQKSIISI